MKKTIAVGCFCIIVIVTVWSTNRSQVLNDAMSMLQLNVGQNDAQMVSTDMGLELLPKDSGVIIGLQGGVFDSPITASVREWLNKEGSSSSFKSTLPFPFDAFTEMLSTQESCGYEVFDKIQSIFVGIPSAGSARAVINLKQSSYKEINQCLGKQYIAYRQNAKILKNKDLDLQFSTMEQGRLVSLKTNAGIMWLRWVNDQRALIEFNDKKPQRVTNSNGILDNKATVALLNRVDQNGSIWLTVLKNALVPEKLNEQVGDIYGSFMMTDNIKGSLTIQYGSQKITEGLRKSILEQIASIPQISPTLAPFEKMFSVTTNPNHEVMINMLMSPELVKQAGTLIKAQFAHK